VPDDLPTPDADRSPAPSGLGATVLEDLVRDGPPARRSRPGRPAWRPGQPLPAIVTAAVAAVVLLAAAAGMVWFRRSAPVDQQLPMTAGASESGATAGAGGGPGAGPGDGALPMASSSTVPTGPLVVHVAGAVARPGVVMVPGGSRVADALAAAGGLRTDADPDRLNLAAVLHDGERVAVPAAGQPAPALAQGGGGSANASGNGAGGGSGETVGTVDLNTATATELEGLPGVGPSTAAAIVEHRTSSGPFRSVEDLLDVRGIGDAKLEQLRAHVTVG